MNINNLKIFNISITFIIAYETSSRSGIVKSLVNMLRSLKDEYQYKDNAF